MSDVEFFDNFLPPLVAGKYQLEVEQTIELPSEYGSPAPYKNTRAIRVAGPHFALQPGDVASFYPPANSQAYYGQVLPNVVFRNRALPWAISLGGATSGPRVAPWMALLLFTPEEVLVPEDSARATGTASGTQVVALADYLTPPSGIAGPAFAQADVAPDTVTVVDVALDAFTAIAPAFDELPFLAHVRRADSSDRELAEDAHDDGWVATVIANRFPTGSASGLYLAHLVSLEGYDGYLPGGGASFPPDTRAVRLIALASWTFNSLEGHDFAASMANLDAGVLRMPDLIPHPTTPEEQAAAGALAGGYTALRHQTRLGEETTGWYRGPCLPIPSMQNTQPAYPSAEAALIYALSDGMFDLSFSTAWQLGRLTALADRQFMIALIDWVQQNIALAQLYAERLELADRYTVLAKESDPGALLAPDLMRRKSHELLTDVLAPMLSPPDPRATQDAPPELVRPRALLGPPRDPSGVLAKLDRHPGVIPPGRWLAKIASKSAGGPIK